MLSFKSKEMMSRILFLSDYKRQMSIYIAILTGNLVPSFNGRFLRANDFVNAKSHARENPLLAG